ncbi:flavin reductase family protein [Undibacterium arcticum]|uniref:flavin reductase family protein n=1 Tax=Undibacterium arcticum TaxID=1762892 RepID=UPI00360966AE
MLVCINRRSPACGAILRNEKFAVNILNRAQRHISDTFAGRPTCGEAFDFSCCEWADGITGIPVIKDAVASFECQVEAVHDIGSHTVFIGRAVAVEKSDQQPLMYSRRGYSHLSP